MRLKGDNLQNRGMSVLLETVIIKNHSFNNDYVWWEYSHSDTYEAVLTERSEEDSYTESSKNKPKIRNDTVGRIDKNPS